MDSEHENILLLLLLIVFIRNPAGSAKAVPISQASLAGSDHLTCLFPVTEEVRHAVYVSAGFSSITFILLFILLQKLKEQIAEVFAEIECFQNADERQEADNNPGKQTRQVGQDEYSFVYKVSLLMLRKHKHLWDVVYNKDREMRPGIPFSPLRFLFIPR